jgi:hypothetical protein
MHALKRLIALLLLAMIPTTVFAISDDRVFAYAEANYPSLFPAPPQAGQITYLNKLYNYRYYSNSGNYLGIDASGVIYILGPYTNNALTEIGPGANYENAIVAWETTRSGAACDATTAPAGINYSQSGNTVTITTAGCIAVPTAGMCTPSAPQATGINVLVTNTTASSHMSGITFNMPGVPNPFEAIGASMVSGTSCITNATSDYASLTINYDICYDISTQLASSVTAMQSTGLIAVSPPITISTQGSTTMQTVANCAATGADTISDAFTGKVEVKQADGTYRQIN